MKNIDKIFNACVDLLQYLADKFKTDYNTINVVIFCIIWPVITILSLALNVILLLR